VSGRGAPRDVRRARLLVAALTIAAVLDLVDAWRGGPPRAPVVGATVFYFVWIGLQFVAQWLGTVAELTVTYLATVVGWIASRVAQLFISTGAVFARVWEGVRIVWSDVLRPALQWVDAWVKRIHTWLVDTFRPVFDYLREIRDRIMGLYRTFVRPVLDVIDFIRAVDQVLLQFHITFLEGLDRVLTDLERRINEPIVWLLRQLTAVQNILDRVVDGFGFFQRYALVASLRKHAPHWMAFFWADQVDRDRLHKDDFRKAQDYPDHDSDKDVVVMTEYFASDSGEAAPKIDELALMLLQVLDGTVPAPLADAA
jgi:hypothetical protein